MVNFFDFSGTPTRMLVIGVQPKICAVKRIHNSPKLLQSSHSVQPLSKPVVDVIEGGTNIAYLDKQSTVPVCSALIPKYVIKASALKARNVNKSKRFTPSGDHILLHGSACSLTFN